MYLFQKYVNNGSRLFLGLSKVPEVEEDALGAMDTVFVWFRFVHAVLVPIFIFVMHKG
jgi:hypothetical protein